jgi:glutamate racemase
MVNRVPGVIGRIATHFVKEPVNPIRVISHIGVGGSGVLLKPSSSLILPDQYRLILPPIPKVQTSSFVTIAPSPNDQHTTNTPDFLTPSSIAKHMPAYSTDGSDPKEIDVIYPLVFADSGVGGLIFALHVYAELERFLLSLRSEYKVEMQIAHLGDAQRAPYGDLSFDAIQNCTMGLVKYGVEEFGSTKVTLACNTASSTINEDFRAWSKATYPDVHVIAIIKHTSRSLYRQAVEAATQKGRVDTYVGVLATPATIKSQQYQQALATLHSEKYSEDANQAPTVIIHNDSRVDPDGTFSRVYLGRNPLPINSTQERDVLRMIAEKRNTVPVQYVLPHAPPRWVPIMEGKQQGSLSAEVASEMARYFAQSSDNKIMSIDFRNLDVLGYCCTHYPFMSNDISKFLTAKGASPILVSQGAAIARDVILQSIRQDVDQANRIKPRYRAIPYQDLPFPLIPFNSHTTVTPGKDADTSSAEIVRKIAFSVNPTIASLIKFSQGAPLDTMPPIPKKT